MPVHDAELTSLLKGLATTMTKINAAIAEREETKRKCVEGIVDLKRSLALLGFTQKVYDKNGGELFPSESKRPSIRIMQSRTEIKAQEQAILDLVRNSEGGLKACLIERILVSDGDYRRVKSIQNRVDRLKRSGELTKGSNGNLIAASLPRLLIK